MWCGAFVDLVLKRLGYKGGGNLASAYPRYGRRIHGPQTAPIAAPQKKKNLPKRRYLGTNPTGRKDLWCGAFVDLVLKRLGYKGGGNLASAYARYGMRIPGPQIGAIAVMTRKGGGHVGIVSGFDSKGRPIIISGNYRRSVAESVYPGGRIYAYVIPEDWDRIVARTH